MSDAQIIVLLYLACIYFWASGDVARAQSPRTPKAMVVGIASGVLFLAFFTVATVATIFR